MRYILDISYKGTLYHGWQIQANAHTVQAELNNALGTILKQKIETIGSGRTDAGVHAVQQIVHFDVPQIDLPEKLVYSLNALLPKEIAIKGLYISSDSFHARFDALSRSYEYKINKDKNPFLNNLSYYFNKKLNVDLMNKAAEILKSHTDFQCFSKSRTSTEHFLCNIFHAEWQEDGTNMIFYVKANRFLRGMVRAIVGTMLEIGMEELSLQDFEKIIVSKDRKKAGRSVPPQGLFLTHVEYPVNLIKKIA